MVMYGIENMGCLVGVTTCRALFKWALPLFGHTRRIRVTTYQAERRGTRESACLWLPFASELGINIAYITTERGSSRCVVNGLRSQPIGSVRAPKTVRMLPLLRLELPLAVVKHRNQRMGEFGAKSG